LAFSIARLIDFEDVTLDAEFGMKVEVVAVAKEDLKAGDTIDGLGGYKTYGICENSDSARKENLLPMGLAEGNLLNRDVKKDELIRFDDVDVKDNKLTSLYIDQIKLTN
jgi:predicted homoserine dehydrogenase-like protein